MHVFDPSAQVAEAGGFLKFKDNQDWYKKQEKMPQKNKTKNKEMDIQRSMNIIAE